MLTIASLTDQHWSHLCELVVANAAARPTILLGAGTPAEASEVAGHLSAAGLLVTTAPGACVLAIVAAQPQLDAIIAIGPVPATGLPATTNTVTLTTPTNPDQAAARLTHNLDVAASTYPPDSAPLEERLASRLQHKAKLTPTPAR